MVGTQAVGQVLGDLLHEGAGRVHESQASDGGALVEVRQLHSVQVLQEGGGTKF